MARSPASPGRRRAVGVVGAALVALVRENGVAIALWAIVAIAAIVRFATLGSQSLDHDEAVTVARILHPSLARTMHAVVNGERSPPLYYVLAWLWTRAFGIGAMGIRSLSAIFGTLTVLAAYLSGRELVSRRVGLIAAALVALNPYLIWYSQEARSYAALVMFGGFALYFFARCLGQPTRASFAGWATMSALALCSHYFAVFAIVAEATILLLAGADRRRALLASLAVAAVGLALLPLALHQEGSGRGNGFTQFPVAQRAETALVKYVSAEGPAPQAGILSTTSGQRQAALVGVALLTVTVAIVATRGSPEERRAASRAGAIAAGAFAVPLLLAWAGFDFVDPRNMIGAVVPALVLAAIGFGARRAALLGGLSLAAALAVFAIVLRFVDSSPATERRDWRALATAIPKRRQPTLYVAPSDARTPLNYYTGLNLAKFQGARFADGIATRRVVVISDHPSIAGPGSGFRLAGTRIAPQHWTVETFTSRHPIPLAPHQLAKAQVMAQPATTLLDDPRALLHAEARTDTRRA